MEFGESIRQWEVVMLKERIISIIKKAIDG